MLTATTDPPATATVPLYLGTLSVVEHWRTGPQLFLTIRCGRCRRDHHHKWGLGADRPTHRTRHCRDVPLRELLRGYFIFPTDDPCNALVLARYRAALTAHQQRVACRT